MESSSQIYDQVNEYYGSNVRSNNGQYEQTVAKAFGYTEEELAGIPDDANLGLSCGNPHVLAKLRDGETVIDLGSGAGFDVFAAGRKIGPTGRAIGVDMNRNMIGKANANKAKVSASNVEFIESTLTSVPLPDGTADCVISNCVINLVPAAVKQLAFEEMFRLLKPGGRVAISDILARKEFTEEIRNNIALYVGCIAGASLVSEYETFLKNAGFGGVLIVDTKSDLNVYYTTVKDGASCGQDPDAAGQEAQTCCNTGTKESGRVTEVSACGGQREDLPNPSDVKELYTQSGIIDFNEWAGSFQVYAVKPTTN